MAMIDRVCGRFYFAEALVSEPPVKKGIISPTLSLDPETYDELVRMAKWHRRTLEGEIEWAIYHWLYHIRHEPKEEIVVP